MLSLLKSTTNFTVLQLEISPADFDALKCLTRDTSTLTALKLTELHTPDLVVGHLSLWLDVGLSISCHRFLLAKGGFGKMQKHGGGHCTVSPI